MKKYQALLTLILNAFKGKLNYMRRNIPLCKAVHHMSIVFEEGPLEKSKQFRVVQSEMFLRVYHSRCHANPRLAECDEQIAAALSVHQAVAPHKQRVRITVEVIQNTCERLG